MKKIVFLLLAILPFVSCDDIETNDVALQARINDRLYQSTDARASTSEGGLKIQGSNMDENLVLSLSSLREGRFAINDETSNYAVFSDVFGNVFDTKDGGEGRVTITEVDEINKTVTGNFSFSAIMPGIDTIYVSRGVLYRVPLVDEDILDPDPDAQEGSFRAKIDGNSFDPDTIITNSGLGTILLSGSTGSESITITVPENIEPGEYEMDWEHTGVLLEGGNEEETSDGAIIISAHDASARTIKGAFWFNTTNHEVTDGYFDLEYEGL